VLAFYVRRGSLLPENAMRIWENAESLLQHREYEVATKDVLRLAAASKCSAYDCEFVALAQALDVPLVTSDAAVLKAFPSVAVPLETFAR
jgi:predicted nucleic acid-binding protein